LPAQVIKDCVLVDKKTNNDAREIISQGLGHKNIDVVSVYIGGMSAIIPIHNKKGKSKILSKYFII